MASACSSWTASLDRSARSPNTSAASKSNRFAWTIESRLSALTFADGVAQLGRGLERRLQVRHRLAVVGRAREDEAELVVRAHRDLGHDLRLGEHRLEVGPGAGDVARPGADQGARDEPLCDVAVSSPASELEREVDRRGQVFERLVARVQAFGPDRGQVVPASCRLGVAGPTVMKREEAERLIDPFGPQLLDRRSGRRVQLAPPPLQQRPVRDLLDQRVREPQLVRLPVAFEQAGAHQLVRFGAGVGSDQPLEEGQVDRTTQHRPGGEHVAGSRLERVQPSQDHLLDRGRELEARARVGHDPPGAFADESAGPDERADQLRQEEGVASGGLDDAPEQVDRDRLAFEQRVDELVDTVVRQRRELDHLVAFGRQRQGRTVAASRREDEQERRVSTLR